MALDLIKEYLVGIGFKVDENSFSDANSSINTAQDNIKKFNEDNNKGFSESGNSLKDLFSLFKTSSGTLAQLFPEARGPFKSMIRDITLLKKLYSNFSNSTDSKKTANEQQSSPTKSKTQSSDINAPNINFKNLSEQFSETGEKASSLTEDVEGITEASETLGTEGVAGMTGFSAVAATGIGLVVVAAVAATVAISKLVSGIADLAKQDIEYEKLSRQLWTTKENAKEIDMAMKTLGVSMQDLWLSPTLLKQFNQLRKDSAALKLPKEYTDNLKTVQDIGLEFSRLKQLGSLAFQWIGNYILKYAAGPLKEIKQTLHDFNESLIQNIKPIASAVGSVIGILVKVISVLFKIGMFINKIFPSIFSIISLIGKIGSAFGDLPEPVKKTVKTIMAIIFLISAPLLLIIGLIDDIMTYFKGGKSVVGGFFDKIKSGMNGIKDGWDYYYNKAVGVFEKIRKKAQEVWNAIKNFFPNLWNNTKEFVIGAGEKVQKFIGNANITSTPPSYAGNTTSNTTSTANSNNKITTTNNFNVYGNNSNSTADAVASKVSGLNTRNMQGVIS